MIAKENKEDRAEHNGCLKEEIVVRKLRVEVAVL